MRIAACSDAEGPGPGLVIGDSIAVIASGNAGPVLISLIEAGSEDPSAAHDRAAEARGETKDAAPDVIFGDTPCNDFTSCARQNKHGRWPIGKSLDTSCPPGSWLVPAGDVPDVAAQEWMTAVNGEERQRARPGDLIFYIPTLIETLTATMTLHPGDRIGLSVAGIGTLSNPVARGDSISSADPT